MLRFIVFFLLITSPSFAQNTVTDSSASFVGYWKKNEKKTFVIKTSKERYSGQKTLAKVETNYRTDVSILDSTANEYLIQWTYSNIQITTPATEAEKEMASLTEGLKVIYKTDELGAFKELVNWEEVQKTIETAITRLLESRDDKDVQKKVLSQMKALYNGRENIEAVAIRDIQLFHSPFGAEYILHKKITAEAELPNVLGGPPFPAVLTTELTAIDRNTNTCTLMVHQQIDKEKGTKAIHDFIRKLVPPDTPETALPVMDISDYNEFVEELETGWLRKALYRRTVMAADMKQIDTMQIDLVTP